MKLKELQEQRAKLIADARANLDKAEKEKRDLSEEESGQYDGLIGEAGKLADKIERERRQIELERSVAANDGGRPQQRGGDAGRDQAALAYDGFRSWLRNGATGAAQGDPDGYREFRSLSAGIDTEGGYLVAPERFIAELIKNIDDLAFIRIWSTTQQVAGAESLGIPSLDADPGDADWTTELATGNEDDSMGFGKRALHPHPLAKRIKISNDLLRRSTLPVESIVRERLAYKFAITQEKAFLIGSGAGRPLGVFVASADGISASRDISTR